MTVLIVYSRSRRVITERPRPPTSLTEQRSNTTDGSETEAYLLVSEKKKDISALERERQSNSFRKRKRVPTLFLKTNKYIYFWKKGDISSLFFLRGKRKGKSTLVSKKKRRKDIKFRKKISLWFTHTHTHTQKSFYSSLTVIIVLRLERGAYLKVICTTTGQLKEPRTAVPRVGLRESSGVEDGVKTEGPPKDILDSHLSYRRQIWPNWLAN